MESYQHNRFYKTHTLFTASVHSNQIPIMHAPVNPNTNCCANTIRFALTSFSRNIALECVWANKAWLQVVKHYYRVDAFAARFNAKDGIEC